MPSAVKRKVQSRKDRTVEAYIGRLPPELFTNIFCYLDFRSLAQCLAVCRIWNDMLNNYSSVWPSFVSMVYDRNSISFDMGWDAGFREKFSAGITDRVLSVLFRGQVQSLSIVTPIVLDHEILLDKATCFIALQQLLIGMETTICKDLVSVLESLPRLTTFVLRAQRFNTRPVGRLANPTVLKLRKLYIESPGLLNAIVADIAAH
jgi:hypothetical protein